MCERDHTWTIPHGQAATVGGTTTAHSGNGDAVDAGDAGLLSAPPGFRAAVRSLDVAVDTGHLDVMLRGHAVARVPMADITSYAELLPVLDILDDAVDLDFEPTRARTFFRHCPQRRITVRRRMALIVQPRWLIAWCLLETRPPGEPWVYRDETWVLGRAPRLRRHLVAIPELARLREPFLGTLWAEEGLGSLVATLANVELGGLLGRSANTDNA